jgi:LuxR family maltose regulon positive regulatory protein
MQAADTLIHTKLRLPFTRADLVSRPRLQERIRQGLRGPLTLITAPAGFGKTTLVASCIAGFRMPVAWLTLDRDDNQVGRCLKYLVAALQEIDETIGSEAAQLVAVARPAPQEAVLTSLINELDSSGREIALVLDDYHFINSRDVHTAVTFLIEHCPRMFHLLIATRSDPPLPLARLQGRGQLVELRSADLRFTEDETARFLNEIMGLQLDARSVAVLEERTEGWIAGLQMAAITMQSAFSTGDRKDVAGFIEGFSGTNRYILDYLLEEVLASQPPEMQCFLLCTSVLDRLTAPLCEAILKDEGGEIKDGAGVPRLIGQSSASLLESLERANLFLVPLDDERHWYRYHHLFADLLRARLDQIYPGLAPQLHLRAAAWHEQNASMMDAIRHASMAPDEEMVERLIEQHYMEMVNRGEMSWIRHWMGQLSKEAVHRRPWLSLYEALNRSWFGQLEEANFLLNEAEKRIHSEASESEARAMQGYHDYVQSRVTAMQGDTRRAIELCLSARENIPADRTGLQNDVSITLGFEYFLYGDFANAEQTLRETIRSGYSAAAINNPVAAYALLARAKVYQGQLHEAHDLLKKAEQLIQEAGGQYVGVTGLIEIGQADLLCEWNDLGAALAALRQGLNFLPMWGKADDLCLAYATLWRIQRALGDQAAAEEAAEKADQLRQAGGLFSEARSAVEAMQVRLWLLQGNWLPIERWMASLEQPVASQDPFRFEDELAHITQARVLLARNRPDEALRLLSCLEESARLGGRQGRLIEIMLLEALARQALEEPEQANLTLNNSLALARPSGYVRIFLDEGRPMQLLIAGWVAQAGASPLRSYAVDLLAQFDAEPGAVAAAQGKVSAAGGASARPGQARAEDEVWTVQNVLVEPISPRELEVLHLISLGSTNQEIARKLVVSPGTVKAHTSSIYRKLDVANRTEAVARARQLGILP